jgi:prenyltransferase beta subunit
MDYKLEAGEELIVWIQQCRNYYGGFQIRPGDSIENDTDPLLSTFAALLYVILKLVNKILKVEFVMYIKMQNKGGDNK